MTTGTQQLIADLEAVAAAPTQQPTWRIKQVCTDAARILADLVDDDDEVDTNHPEGTTAICVYCQQQILLDQLCATTSGAAGAADARLQAWQRGLRAWERGLRG